MYLKLIVENSGNICNCIQFTLYNMSDSDNQQQIRQMTESYNNIADNHQPDAARDMQYAIRDLIQNTGFQSQTAEKETGW